MSDPIEMAQSWLDRHALSCARGHAHQHNVCEISQALLDRERQLRELWEAAMALYEQVEMGESVGICLADRVPSLRLGAALAASDRET